jgi:hypothetical protein
MGWEDEFIVQRPDIKQKLTKKRVERDLWLRKTQNRIARRRKPEATTMAIFLGKQNEHNGGLGQADKQEMTLKGDIEMPLVVVIGGNGVKKPDEPAAT